MPITEQTRKRAMYLQVSIGSVGYVLGAIYFLAVRPSVDGIIVGWLLASGLGLSFAGFQLHMMKPEPEDVILNE